MSVFRLAKVVSALPGTLTADTLYLVRAGTGFDFYVSDSTGTVAHALNSAGAHTHNVSELGDVNLTALADGEILAWDAANTQWVNTTASGSGPHTHLKADITDFNDADYAAASHTHTKSEVTDFPTVVPQAEAEAGTATTERIWTAQRVAQAIAALASGGGGGSGIAYATGTTAERPAAPTVPTLYYNTEIVGLELYYPEISTWEMISTFAQQVDTTSDSGQVAFTAPGTHTWICPANVYQVCGVCVGGGGGGLQTSSGGGGGAGGGLGWRNAISVVPGQSYTVQVGDGGIANATAGNETHGGDSFFISAGTVAGFGGKSATFVDEVRAGGGFFHGGSGGGGQGGNSAVKGSGNYASGGGGAGGYSGSGGQGASAFGKGTNGTGGAAAGGSGSSSTGRAAGSGGGVGLFGEGASGVSTGTQNSGYGYPGGGGSGGVTPAFHDAGGVYGGGGGGSDNTLFIKGGGFGAVRLIWGPGRAFPSTNTGDV